MPVNVVTDYERSPLAAAIVHDAGDVVGRLLIAAALLASLGAIPTSFFVVGLAVTGVAHLRGDPEPWPPPGLPVASILLIWGLTTPLAVLGLQYGLRLLRRPRGVLLFLRRFGHDGASRVVTFAVEETLGSRWRVVTLDDAEIVPLGVSRGASRLTRLHGLLWPALSALGRRVGMQLFPYTVLAMWAVLAIQALLVRDDWRAFLEDGRADQYMDAFAALIELRLPFYAVAPTLPGLFAALGIVAALAFLVLGATFVALLLAFPFAAVIFFIAEATGAVRAAENARTAVVRSSEDITSLTVGIEASRRRVFAPRLLVLRVAHDIWQPTVARLAEGATAVLLDVSEPTENVLWELRTLRTRPHVPLVVVAQLDAARSFLPAGSPPAGSQVARVAALLDGRDVLAYTTSGGGLRRFARALHRKLLSLTS